ncbi:MAG: hypothetical protein WBM69_11550 [Desulfobacterales bacterium]
MTANIESYIDDINNLTSYIVQGTLMTDQIIATIDEFFSEKPTKYVLWNFSQAQIAQISNNDIKEIVKIVTKYADRNIVLKTALVFSEDGAFGLGRMFEMLAEMEETPQQFMSFRNADDAYKWLSAT